MTPELVNRLVAHEVVRQFLRFLAVGVVATSVHYAILISLKEGAHVNAVAATCFGYGGGAIVSYTLNRLFTFEVRPHFARGFAKFMIVVIVGFALNAAIVAGLTHFGVYYLLAQLIATGLVLSWNFTASRLLVFR